MTDPHLARRVRVIGFCGSGQYVVGKQTVPYGPYSLFPRMQPKAAEEMLKGSAVAVDLTWKHYFDPLGPTEATRMTPIRSLGCYCAGKAQLTPCWICGGSGRAVLPC